MLNQKVNTSGNSVISGSLEANVFRCGGINHISDDDLNALALTQSTANEPIIDLRTEESVATMYLKVKGLSYIGLSTTNNITLYEDTTLSGSLEAQKLILNKPSNDSETPLNITNNNQHWGVIALESTIAGDGCFQNFKTAQITDCLEYWDMESTRIWD